MILQGSVIAIRVLRKLHRKTYFRFYKVIYFTYISPALMSVSKEIRDIPLQK